MKNILRSKISKPNFLCSILSENGIFKIDSYLSSEEAEELKKEVFNYKF